MTKKFIQDLEKMGLMCEEAQIYFSLIHHGKRGTYIKNLTEELPIKRTTIYSIINRLIKKDCVRENTEAEGPKGAKIYSAISPESYINRIISQKNKELDFLEKIRDNSINKMEDIYLKSVEFSIEEIDEILRPYLEPLLANGWKIIEKNILKDQINLGFEVYDLNLLIPEKEKAFVKDGGFLLFIHDHNIEEDEDTLKFMYNMLKRKGKEEILNKGIGVVEIELNETIIEIYEKEYQGYLPRFRFEHQDKFVDLTETVMIPIKNKLFCLWAENHEFIEEIADCIFSVENK